MMSIEESQVITERVKALVASLSLLPYEDAAYAISIRWSRFAGIHKEDKVLPSELIMTFARENVFSFFPYFVVGRCSEMLKKLIAGTHAEGEWLPEFESSRHITMMIFWVLIREKVISFKGMACVDY